MEKKNIRIRKRCTLNWWCDRAWIAVEEAIAALMLIALLLNWKTWNGELKTLAFIVILIPLHVLEEWIFPGGFHYQYNLVVYRSDLPNTYPMCRLSDMYTNMLATIFYAVLTIICILKDGHVSPGILLGTSIFSVLELFMHTWMGTKMYHHFKPCGKKTIYGPGSVTAYLGFLPLGIFSFYYIKHQEITATDLSICIGVLLYIALICILIPENTIKSRNTPYNFENAGYFERFL